MDGRNPAPPWMVETLTKSWDNNWCRISLAHPQYVELPSKVRPCMGFLQIQDDLLGPGPYLGEGMVKFRGSRLRGFLRAETRTSMSFSQRLVKVASINGKCIH